MDNSARSARVVAWTDMQRETSRAKNVFRSAMDNLLPFEETTATGGESIKLLQKVISVMRVSEKTKYEAYSPWTGTVK